MATRNIVPRANDEGNIGTALKRWVKGWFKDLYVSGVLTDGVNSGTIANILGATIFGASFQNAESLTQSDTTSGTYQQKLRMTTPSLPVGRYRVGWNFEWLHSSGAGDFQTRVQVNDTTDLMVGNMEPQEVVAWHPVGGFAYFDVASPAVLNIDLDYSSENANTASIRRARLEIWRVS